MATKRVTLTKSNGTTSSFTFTIPEEVGTYNLKFTLDSKESKTQSISGSGVQDTTQSGLTSVYHYSYSVNIGLGATLVTISPSTVSGTTNTANYNSSTGVVSGTIYSMLKRCSATLSWQGPKVIDAGNIVVNENVNTYRLSFGMSDGSTINAGTFTTPAIVSVQTLTAPILSSIGEDWDSDEGYLNYINLVVKNPNDVAVTVYLTAYDGNTVIATHTTNIPANTSYGEDMSVPDVIYDVANGKISAYCTAPGYADSPTTTKTF